MSVKIHIGIKKNKNFSENLEALRSSIKTNGFKPVFSRLEEMKGYFWVNHSDDPLCACLVCSLERAILLDKIREKQNVIKGNVISQW